ncbi:MAG: hypothetical protein IJB98_02925, partial [Clostridia bacterium]|nr:hypothetical protein [Clostridia bacterium]
YDKDLVPSDNIPDAIKQANSISGTSGKFSRVPDYGNDSLAESLFSERQPHIQFFRHSFIKGCVRFDFSFNPLKLFGEGNLWRFKLAFLSGVSNLEEKTLKFTITNGRLYLDYNFNSVKHLTLNTFFMPSKLNVVVLVFASILLFSVLGQAVWGLVARIYDIVLYFIIMPAVVSSTVIQSDSKIYNNWQSSLISKVMGSYGVLMGINFFFLLVPAIKEASQLFTDHDLATNISQGSWLSFMTADAVNNLVYILFLLVAFTIIKTLPGTIGNLIGLKKGDEAYGAGASVKKSVDSVISDVSHHVSGASLLEAKSNAGAMIKNFTPGSAIYDDWKKKHPKKSREEIAAEKDAAEKRRGADIARQEAEAQQQLAQQQMEAGNAQRNAQRPGEQSETGTDVNNIPANDVDEVRTATLDLDGTHESSAGTHPDVENAVDENQTTNRWSGRHVPIALVGSYTEQEYKEWQEARAEQQRREGNNAEPGQELDKNTTQTAVQNEAQNATRAAAQNAVENAVQGDGGAAAYAASAAASAAAAQAYADIASGNTAGYAQRADAEAAAQKQAEKQQKEAEKAERANETRDERKLRELKEELAAAESDTKIAPWKIEQAFETFNKNKALEDQVIESMTYYNSNFDKRVMELAKQEDISVAKAQKAVKNELAVAHWNKTHKDNQITTESLANDAKLRREVNNEFKDHQSRLQATAKNELITNKIQEKINKQETKMELKARGLYQNTLQKALSSNGILHKTTDSDRIMLANKRNDAINKLDRAELELDKVKAQRQKMVNLGKSIVNDNKEIDKEIAREQAKIDAANNLRDKKIEEIKSGKAGKKAEQIKNKAIQDANMAQNRIDELRAEQARNEQVLQDKARELTQFDNTTLAKAESNFKKAQNNLARYEQALDGNYQGVLAGLARRTANGGRYVKAGTHLAAQRIAEGLANSTAKSVEKKEEKKVKSEHSSNDNEKFTESQIRNLDKKMGSVKATNAALENYARSHGFDVSSLKDKNNQTKNITKKDMKDILDAQMKKELGRNAHSEANVIRAQYAEMQKEVDKLFVQKDKAIDNYNQAKREFNRQNHNSFVRRDTRLGKKQIAAAQIAKSRLISEVNDKNRKGIMTPAEEKEYVRRIQSYDQAIADATERRVAYHKMRKQITDTKLGRKFVSARGVVNEKTAPAREFVKKSATAVKGWVGTAKDVTKAVKTTISESAAVAKKIAKYAAGQASFYTKMAATAVKDFATERALDVKDATYGRYKRAKNTKAYMASAEHAQNRQSYIAKNAGRLEARKNRDIYAAESIRRTGQAILQQQLDKKFVNRIKSDLAKSGMAGNIPKVTNRSAAEAYAMKISPKQNTMESAIHKAINNQMKNIVDGVVKATDKMPKAYLHKADSPTLQAALNRSANFHRALKAVESRLKKELRESTKL